MGKGSISFVFDGGDGEPPVFATYEVADGAVARILAAHGAYYGKVPADPDEPEAPGRKMRDMTAVEVLHRWADGFVDAALELTRGYEAAKATEAALETVAKIEVN